MFQFLSIFTVVACMTFIVSKLYRNRSQSAIRRVVWSMFLIYMIGNLYCTTFSRVPNSGRMIDLRPFKTYFELFKEPPKGGGEVTGLFAWFMKDASSIVGLILNILLYYPLGYLLPILFPKIKPKHVILIGCLCSIATEATQYLLKMGWCETDDVIHNTLGTAIGVWVWHLQSKRLNKPQTNELPKD